MTETFSRLQKINESIQDRIDMGKCYNYSPDLTRLFIFYYIMSLLKTFDNYKQSYNTWSVFNEKILIMKRQTKNKAISQSVLEDFVDPMQTELNHFNINLLNLHELIHQRHFKNHQHICSCDEQKTFIEFLEQYGFSNKFTYRDLQWRLLCC